MVDHHATTMDEPCAASTIEEDGLWVIMGVDDVGPIAQN